MILKHTRALTSNFIKSMPSFWWKLISAWGRLLKTKFKYINMLSNSLNPQIQQTKRHNNPDLFIIHIPKVNIRNDFNYLKENETIEKPTKFHSPMVNFLQPMKEKKKKEEKLELLKEFTSQKNANIEKLNKNKKLIKNFCCTFATAKDTVDKFSEQEDIALDIFSSNHFCLLLLLHLMIRHHPSCNL